MRVVRRLGRRLRNAQLLRACILSNAGDAGPEAHPLPEPQNHAGPAHHSHHPRVERSGGSAQGGQGTGGRARRSRHGLRGCDSLAFAHLRCRVSGDALLDTRTLSPGCVVPSSRPPGTSPRPPPPPHTHTHTPTHPHTHTPHHPHTRLLPAARRSAASACSRCTCGGAPPMCRTRAGTPTASSTASPHAYRRGGWGVRSPSAAAQRKRRLALLPEGMLVMADPLRRARPCRESVPPAIRRWRFHLSVAISEPEHTPTHHTDPPSPGQQGGGG
jgi:hypothetical protein